MCTDIKNPLRLISGEIFCRNAYYLTAKTNKHTKPKFVVYVCTHKQR